MFDHHEGNPPSGRFIGEIALWNSPRPRCLPQRAKRGIHDATGDGIRPLSSRSAIMTVPAHTAEISICGSASLSVAQRRYLKRAILETLRVQGSRSAKIG